MRNCYLLLLLLCACTPAYVPNLRNAPMFTKKGEFQGSMQIMNGYEAQTAFSLSNNIAIMGNFAYGYRGRYSENSNYHRHKLVEGAFGYYRNEGKFGYQIFGGFGEGSAEGLYDFIFSSGSTPTLARFNRYFVQPGIGFYKPSFTMAVVARISKLDFTLYRDQVTSLTYDKEDMFFFEPAFIAQYYFANHKMFVTMQTGLAVSLRDDIDDGFQYRVISFGTGIGLRLGGTRDLISPE
jgi:hypothetical protein